MTVLSFPIRWMPPVVAFLIWTIPVSNLRAQAVRLLPIEQPAPAVSPIGTQTEPTLRVARPQSEPQRDRQQACVLLKNDNVLFGDAHQLGEMIIVQTGPDDELRLPRSEVACWAKSIADLYRYRLDHRTAKGVDVHLSDARWCMQYELLDEAAQELVAAKNLSPNHHALQRLEGQLKRLRQPAKPRRPAVARAAFIEPPRSDDVGEANRVDPATLHGFASHVQPTLINRCVRCHHQKSKLQWRLTTSASGSRPTAPITRENLAASLRFVDRINPQQSLLLTKGTSPHGGVDAPLTARNATAIEALKEWLMQIGETVDRPKLGKVSDVRQTEQNDANAVVAPVSFTASLPNQAGTQSNSSASSNQPQRLPTVANPFDPSLFNRRFHRGQP